MATRLLSAQRFQEDDAGKRLPSTCAESACMKMHHTCPAVAADVTPLPRSPRYVMACQAGVYPNLTSGLCLQMRHTRVDLPNVRLF